MVSAIFANFEFPPFGRAQKSGFFSSLHQNHPLTFVNSRGWAIQTMKPLTPISAIVLAVASTVAAEDYFPYAKPTTRFQPFHKLDSTSQTIAEELGYLDITWNNFGLAPIEDKGWNDLTAEEQDAATLLGFFEGTW